MINEKNLVKHFDFYKSNDLIDFICDYCGIEFKRKKKSFAKSRKIINKDCCDNKDCVCKKRKESCLVKYGSECSLQAEEIKIKTKNTCLKKYNSEYSSKSEIVKEKIKKTNIKKYGVENVFSSLEIKEKIKQSMLEKYGFEHALQSLELQEKRKNTLFQNHGCEHALQNKELQEKKKNSIFEKYGCEHALQNEDIKNKFFTTNLEKYGSAYPYHKYGKTQKEIQEWLNSLSFNFNSDFKILEGKELDLYDSNLRLAIEYCGLFWHHENSPQPRLKNYHEYKYKKCKEKNIQLITVFEDEWKNKKNIIKSVILSKIGVFEKRIYARKCLVKEISKKDFVCFCDKYHVQGGNNLAKICFGLFFENELIGVMDLGNHHRKKIKEEIVLTRLCFKAGYQIVGGASKLFNMCVSWCKNNKIKKIISWSDNRWSDGSVYKNLKFELVEELSPDYFYVQIKSPKERISKQSQKKSNTGCPENKSEKEWALENGLSRIWDCGKIRWEFLIKNL